MVHCHESFPEEFNELYVDMLSACVSVFLFAIVSKTCFTPKPLDFMDHVFMGLFGFLVVFNGVCYVLTIIDAGHSLNSRCGFHLLIAMPLSKGYFFTSVAVMDYLGNTTLFRGAAHGKKAGVKDRVAGVSEQVIEYLTQTLDHYPYHPERFSFHNSTTLPPHQITTCTCHPHDTAVLPTNI